MNTQPSTNRTVTRSPHDTPASSETPGTSKTGNRGVEAGRRLSPARIEDWPAMVQHTNVRPALGDHDPADPKIQAAFCRYVEQLGPIWLPDVRRVANAIDEAHFENDMSLVGTQRCVIVDGRPHAGKTYAVLTKAFAEARAVWQTTPPDAPTSSRSIPWIYVEVPPRAQALSLYQAILAFCGVPIPGGTGRTNATRLATTVRDLAPHIGLRGVIIDDSHGVAGTDRQFIGDILKTVVTGIPATVVIIGAGLRERQIFDTLPGEQVLERATWIHVGDWPVPGKTGDVGAWGDLAAYFTKAQPLPDPHRNVILNSRHTLAHLARGSGLKPGTAIKWLKRAARHAITHHVDLDLAALRATEPLR